MTMVFFIYGMTFFLFGTAILFQMQYDFRAALGRAFWILGVFGVTHGIAEWLDMFKMLKCYEQPECALYLKTATFFFKTSSFLFLATYGFVSLAEFGVLSARWVRWILGALFLLPALGLLAFNRLTASSAGWGEALPLLRTFLVLPGASATAVAFFLLRDTPEVARLSKTRVRLSLAALGVVFFLYAVFAGICTDPGRIFPANALNTAIFAKVFGFPVQLLRAACAICSAVFITIVLTVLSEAFKRQIVLDRDVAIQADRAKSLFLANVSHELRTPMHGILSFARFGQKETGSASQEELKSYFDEIYGSGSRLMSLLNDLLDLSKLEAGKIVYSMQEDDFVAVARSIKSEMSALAQEKRLAIEIKPAAQEVIGSFDAERMMQVLRNLVSNAIKFSEAGTTILVQASVIAERVRCSVVNRGVGIPSSELESVFDKFVQSSKTRTGSGGTGLGLAICKEIVEQHGGRIWAESEPRGETRFIFEWPQHGQTGIQRAA